MSVNQVHQEREQDSRSTRLPKTARDYIRYAVIAFAAFWILLVATIAVGRFAGFSTVTVLSPSMVPVASPGALLVTRPFDGNVILNDIYVFDDPKDAHATSHRIIQKGAKPNEWITKGDANDSADIHPITTNLITAHVVAVIPPFTNILPFLDSLPGRMLTLTVPFMLMMAPLLKKRQEDEGLRAAGTLKKSKRIPLRVFTAAFGFLFLVLVGVRSFLGIAIATVPVTAESHGIPANAVVFLLPKPASSIENGDIIQVQMPNALTQTLERIKDHRVTTIAGVQYLVLDVENSQSPTGITSVQVKPENNVFIATATIPMLGGFLPGIGSPAGFAAITGLFGTAGTLLLMHGVASRPAVRRNEEAGEESKTEHEELQPV